jgi:autophagy-related protein 17
LLVEIARRRQYKKEAENFVRDMMTQLETMSEGVFLFPNRPVRLFRLDDISGERVVRESFNAEHGAHLPSDLCLYIENPPTRWQVIPFDGDTVESLPDVDDDLVAEVDLNTLHVSSHATYSCLMIGQGRYCEGRRTGARK